jgi:hypothetical protein
VLLTDLIYRLIVDGIMEVVTSGSFVHAVRDLYIYLIVVATLALFSIVTVVSVEGHALKTELSHNCRIR